MEHAFRTFFEKLRHLPDEHRLVLFALPDPEEDGDPVSVIFGDERTESGWRVWHPVYASELDVAPDLAFLGDDVHPDARAYFSSAYFGEIHARSGDVSFSLSGLLPETLAEDFARRVAGQDRLLPIGLEHSSDLQVVLDLDRARVGVWDWERGQLTVLAESVRELIAGMTPG